MIQRATASLAKLWAKNGVIPANEMDAYQYGLELLLSTAANIAVMVILPATAGHPWFFIPYLAAFIPLRLSAGGYPFFGNRTISDGEGQPCPYGH